MRRETFRENIRETVRYSRIRAYCSRDSQMIGKLAITGSALLVLTALPAFSHDIITTNLTYTRDISRIFARRCTACHASGSSIPLTTYSEVRPWAVDIKEQVLSRTMPPWGAVKGFGSFSADGGLTQEEILIIGAWVVGGAPEGDPAMLPASSKSLHAPTPPLIEALKIDTSSTLTKPLLAYGLEPSEQAVIASSRITATLPDGRIEPLVWLYQYDPKYKHSFRFRMPLELPAGTLVQANSPVRYVLETSTQRAFTGNVNTTVLTSPWR